MNAGPQIKRAHDVAEVSAAQLGELLVEDEVITARQLKRATRVHKRMRTPRWLGHVLVELRLCYQSDIDRTLNRRGLHLPLLEYLVSHGHLAEDVLQTLQEETEPAGMDMGLEDMLVARDFIDRKVLLRALSERMGLPMVQPALELMRPELMQRVPMGYLRRHLAIPLAEDEGSIITVMADPRSEIVCKELTAALGQPVLPAFGDETLIADLLDQWAGGARAAQTSAAAMDAPAPPRGHDSVPRLVEHLVGEAIAMGASDLHIEPLGARTQVRLRIDGVLFHLTDLPAAMHLGIASRIKVLSKCDIAERRKHQDGRFEVKVPETGEVVELRVSTYVTVHGENVVMRLLRQSGSGLSLRELGMAPSVRKALALGVLDTPSGIVLTTGPTGSGKTTSLYTYIARANGDDVKIITVEDPVECVIPGVIQCQIEPKAGRTFGSTLRAMMRQDPDIILIGEIRDRETAEVAIEATLTGHKVFSTFHAPSALSALVRLRNMGIEPALLTSTVHAVVGQRLVRRVCQECQTSVDVDPAVCTALGLPADYLRGVRLMAGAGCEHCRGTGYRGRSGVYEALRVDDGVLDVITGARAVTPQTTIGNWIGYRSLLEDGLVKAARGWTTLEELLRVCPSAATPRPLIELDQLWE